MQYKTPIKTMINNDTADTEKMDADAEKKWQELNETARFYAQTVMKRYPSCDNWKIPVKELLAEAYVQGWVDLFRNIVKITTIKTEKK